MSNEIKQQPMNSLITSQISNIPQIRELQIEQIQFEFDYRKATALFNSGIYSKKYQNQNQIFAILQEGRTLGFNSSEAMNGLYLVAGGVQMFGSLKTSYLQKRGYKINFTDETVESNKLVKSTCIVTKEDERYEATVTVDQLKDGKNNGGLKNAPMTKVRYEAINRILKTQLSGAIPDIVSRSEDDYVSIEAIENKASKVQVIEAKDEILDFINNDVTNIQALKSVKDQLVTDEQKQAYETKVKELTPSKPDLVVDAPAIKPEPTLTELAKAKYPENEFKDYIQMIANQFGVETLEELPEVEQKNQIELLNLKTETLL